MEHLTEKPLAVAVGAARLGPRKSRLKYFHQRLLEVGEVACNAAAGDPRFDWL